MGLTRVNDMLYFSGWNKKLGRELWRFDGFSVSIVADIYADSMASGPTQFTVFDNTTLFFTAENRTTGRELYQLGEAVVKVKDMRTTDAPHIFPNPASDNVKIELNLTSDKVLNVRVTNISGKTVYESKPANYTASKMTITIPVNDFVPGNYILHVYDKQGNLYATEKFLKE
jgi:ELWxxDGT repeat protein